MTITHFSLLLVAADSQISQVARRKMEEWCGFQTINVVRMLDLV